MKNIVITYILLFISATAVTAQQPEEVFSFAKVYKPHSYYVEQAELWWKEIQKDKSNENAWYNYFKANRFAKGTYKDQSGFDPDLTKGWISESNYLKEGKDIIALTDKHIKGTFTNHYIRWWNEGSSPENFEHLQKAYEINPSHVEMFDGFVVYYEIQGEPELRKKYNKIWHEFNDLSQGFLYMGYNQLQSMEQDGIILTFGDNDTFPLWMLQDVFNIRTDVTVLCVPLLSIDDYRKRTFSELGIPPLQLGNNDGGSNKNQETIVDHIIENKPQTKNIYISTPAWKEFKRFEDKLYLTGIVFQYSETSIDNIAIMKNNFEYKYQLDYLYNQFNYDISQSLVDKANVNYLPALIKLYEHSKLSGEIQLAEKYKKLGLLIANKAGDDWKAKAKEIFN